MAYAPCQSRTGQRPRQVALVEMTPKPRTAQGKVCKLQRSEQVRVLRTWILEKYVNTYPYIEQHSIM